MVDARVSAFVEARCARVDGGTSAADLYAAYGRWVGDSPERAQFGMSSRAFGRAMGRLGFLRTRNQVARGWWGVVLRGDLGEAEAGPGAGAA